MPILFLIQLHFDILILKNGGCFGFERNYIIMLETLFSYPHSQSCGHVSLREVKKNLGVAHSLSEGNEIIFVIPFY